MKFTKLLLAILLYAFVGGCITVPPEAEPSANKPFDYVTNLEGMKNDAIYDGVKMWIAENFRSAKQVIDLENKEQGVIIGNGAITGLMLNIGTVTFTMTASFKMKVEVKDEKMRLTFFSFEVTDHTFPPRPILYQSESDQIKARLTNYGNEIASYLKNRKSSNF